jgi:hypothetical protein
LQITKAEKVTQRVEGTPDSGKSQG